MTVEKIFVGGWFQRTILHLSEMYDFFKEADSPLDLDKKKLAQLRKELHLSNVELIVKDLEYILLTTRGGIEVKIFEDGLILLGTDNTSTLKADIEKLTSYYEERLSPAVNYLFSLGAPVPKELAKIKTVYPYFVILKKATETDIQALLKQFQQKKYFEVKQGTFEIYRGDKLYIINHLSEPLERIEKFIQEQIFMREFKGQLHRYLNLHRIIWERIAEVKEKGEIRGSDVGAFKTKIEEYAKTINLIGARINQMGAYLSTRASVVRQDPDMKPFMAVLQFRHETLQDTLSYVQELWGMTKNYVDSALALFSGIQAESTESSVENLTIITSMGVGATLIGLFAQDAPEFTLFGVGYFLALAAIGYAADRIMKAIARRRSYAIQDTELAKDLE